MVYDCEEHSEPYAAAMSRTVVRPDEQQEQGI